MQEELEVQQNAVVEAAEVTEGSPSPTLDKGMRKT